MSPVISKRVARELRAAVSLRVPAEDGRMKLMEALDAALKPKRSAGPARQRRVAKRATQREEMVAIRGGVMARADGRCEACHQEASGPLQLDHMLGGSNRRTLQSKYTCWALDADCHWQKTTSQGGAADWLKRFLEHSDRRASDAELAGMEGEAEGYRQAGRIVLARLESLQLQGRTEGES